MKKILIVLLALVGAPALATTICAEDDVIAIVLDPEVNGTNHTYNTNLFEWGATFSYGSVWGIATCLDKNGSYGVAVDELRSEDGELATGGERKGKYCWCQMTHPAVSRWVFRGAFSSVDDCRSNCASYCGYNVRVLRFPRGRVRVARQLINGIRRCVCAFAHTPETGGGTGAATPPPLAPNLVPGQNREWVASPYKLSGWVVIRGLPLGVPERELLGRRLQV